MTDPLAGTASTYTTSTVALLDNYKQQFERLYSIDYITKLIQLKRRLVLVWCARPIYVPAHYKLNIDKQLDKYICCM